MSATPPNKIRCACVDCSGAVWSIEQIRAHPALPREQAVNGMTLPGISRATGHEFYYDTGKVAGKWRKAKPETRVDAPARAGWVFNSAPEAMEVLPVNPNRLTACDGPSEGA